MKDEKIVAREIFFETLSQYEVKIEQLEVALRAANDDGVLSVGPRTRRPRSRTVKEAHSREKGYSSPAERRPFIAAASNFMAHLVGATASSREASGIPTPRDGEQDIPRDDTVSTQEPPQGVPAPSPTKKPYGLHTAASDAIYGLAKKPGACYTTLRNTLPGLSKVCASGKTAATTIGSSHAWRTLVSGKPSPLFSSGGTASSCVNFHAQQKNLIEAWLPVLDDWEQKSRTAQFQKRLLKGVPYALRTVVWRKAIGNRLLVTRSLYRDVVHRVNLLRKYLLRHSSRYRTRLENTLGRTFIDADVSLIRSILDSSDGPPSAIFAGSSQEHNSDVTLHNHASFLIEPHVMPYSISKAPCFGLSSAEGNVGLSEVQNTDDSGCSFCAHLWDTKTISAFETISCDLHRVLPRFGVPVACRPDADEDKEPPVASADSVKDYTAKRFCVQQAVSSDSSAPPDGEAEQSSLSVTSSTLPLESVTGTVTGGSRGFGAVSVSSTESGVRPLPKTITTDTDGVTIYGRLRLLLEAFSLFRPDIGYVQGMGYLAAMFVLHMSDDFEAFLCFANLMCRQSLYAFYTFDLEVITILFSAFDVLLREKLPAAAEAFAVSQIHSSQFLIDWMYTLFTRCLPFDLVSRIWDLFIVEGDTVLFQMCLALVRHIHSDDVAADGDRLSSLLSSSSTDHFNSISTETFLDQAATLTIPRSKLSRIIKTLHAQQTTVRFGRGKKLTRCPSETPHQVQGGVSRAGSGIPDPHTVAVPHAESYNGSQRKTQPTSEYSIDKQISSIEDPKPSASIEDTFKECDTQELPGTSTGAPKVSSLSGAGEVMDYGNRNITISSGWSEALLKQLQRYLKSSIVAVPARPMSREPHAAYQRYPRPSHSHDTDPNASSTPTASLSSKFSNPGDCVDDATTVPPVSNSSASGQRSQVTTAQIAVDPQAVTNTTQHTRDADDSETS